MDAINNYQRLRLGEDEDDYDEANYDIDYDALYPVDDPYEGDPNEGDFEDYTNPEEESKCE